MGFRCAYSPGVVLPTCLSAPESGDECEMDVEDAV